MMMLYIGVASIAAMLLLLWILGKFGDSGQMSAPDVESKLRDLLLAKAEGRISQAEFDARQAELHGQILSSSQGGAATGGKLLRYALPVAAVVLAGVAYLGLRGESADLPAGPVQQMPVAASSEADVNAPANKGGDLNTAVKRLEEKMAKDPQNGEGWLLLAKTYGELRRFADADRTYEKAAAILPPNAGMLADWADAHVMANNREWDEAGRQIVKRALSADPKHLKSLALAGSEAFDRKDYKGAIAFWKRMKAAAPADSMDSKLADSNIAEANSILSGGKPAAVEETASAAKITGVVTISPKLKAKLGDQDVLFIFAKSPEGGPPLGAVRIAGPKFPVSFVLDENSAIMPGRSIAQFAEVQLSAKISKSGNAMPTKGDLLAKPVTVRVGADNQKLEIDSEL